VFTGGTAVALRADLTALAVPAAGLVVLTLTALFLQAAVPRRAGTPRR
jgi:hypothetical protein